MDLIAATAIIAIKLIVLHRIDGAEIAVNPAQITALHPPTAENKLLIRPARCAVWLGDGRLLAVMESCDQVKAMLESARP